MHHAEFMLGQSLSDGVDQVVQQIIITTSEPNLTPAQCMYKLKYNI